MLAHKTSLAYPYGLSFQMVPRAQQAQEGGQGRSVFFQKDMWAGEHGGPRLLDSGRPS